MAVIDSHKIRVKTGEALIIRSARPQDARAILRHARIILREDLYNVTTLSEARWTIGQERKWIREHNRQPGQIVLAAEAGGRIVGMLSGESGTRRRQRHVCNIHLSVHPKFRRTGIATALIRAAIGWAKENPVIEKLTLEVFRTNRPAIRLYGKMGFKREGLRAKAIKTGDGKYIDDILMAKFVKNQSKFKN
jgi:RimJ/RimL family protein N-acetyltransferase